MDFTEAGMADDVWIGRACAQVGQLVKMHPEDTRRVVEDLRRSWPALGPEEAVNFFFRPLQPGCDVVELA
jgi:hypothetical protein